MLAKKLLNSLVRSLAFVMESLPQMIFEGAVDVFGFKDISCLTPFQVALELARLFLKYSVYYFSLLDFSSSLSLFLYFLYLP